MDGFATAAGTGGWWIGSAAAGSKNNATETKHVQLPISKLAIVGSAGLATIRIKFPALIQTLVPVLWTAEYDRSGLLLLASTIKPWRSRCSAPAISSPL